MSGMTQKSPALDVISLKVSDGDASVTFYQNYLGLDKLVEENDIAYLGTKATNQTLIAIYEFSEGISIGDKKNTLARFSLEVPTDERFTAIKTALNENNYPFDLFESPSGHEVIRVLDPEAHTIDLLNMSGLKTYEESQGNDEDGTIEPSFVPRRKKTVGDQLAIHAVRLAVNDVRQSQQFYTNILGFSEKVDEKGTKLAANQTAADYLRLTDANEEIATDDDYFGLDYLAFRLPNEEELTAYAESLKAKNQDIYYSKRQGLIQIDDPDGNHLWFYL